MSTSTEKSDYLLLFRGTNWDKGLSPEQIQKVVTDWYAWFERLFNLDEVLRKMSESGSK